MSEARKRALKAQHQLRMEVQSEINQHKVNINRSWFKKNEKDRAELLTAKAKFKKNPYKNESQQEVFNQIGGYITDPKFKIKFGSLTLIQVDHA